MKVNNSCMNRPNVLKEVQLMNSLNHPNVIKLMGVCVHNGQMHALTEFANGGCLEQLINNHSVEFQWIDRINIASDIARGLNYLHSKFIIHRDLTSKNILLKIDPSQTITAIVGDLGLATKVKDLEKESSLSVVGSPYWMAPECINGLPYNAKADVFSYGIVLCEMIARVEADPDYLPRTENFGVDYVAFGKLAKDCPINFLQFTFNCCQVDPVKRPTFNDLLSSIDVI
uniref:dual-specificity kinase n=1 Tax=Helobdella robusta TaxID=6412 RepID=T1EI63_HELRO